MLLPVTLTCLQPSCSMISGGNTREAKALLQNIQPFTYHGNVQPNILTISQNIIDHNIFLSKFVSNVFFF